MDTRAQAWRWEDGAPAHWSSILKSHNHVRLPWNLSMDDRFCESISCIFLPCFFHSDLNFFGNPSGFVLICTDSIRSVKSCRFPESLMPAAQVGYPFFLVAVVDGQVLVRSQRALAFAISAQLSVKQLYKFPVLVPSLRLRSA